MRKMFVFFILPVIGCTNNPPIANDKKDSANSSNAKIQSGIPVLIDSKKFRQFDDIEENHTGIPLDSEFVKSTFSIPDSWFKDKASKFTGDGKFKFSDTISLYFVGCSDEASQKSLLFTVDKFKKRIVDFRFFMTRCFSCEDTVINLVSSSTNINGKVSYKITAKSWTQKDLKKYLNGGKEPVDARKENITVDKEGNLVTSIED